MEKLLVFGRKGKLECKLYPADTKFDPPKPPIVETSFAKGVSDWLFGMSVEDKKQTEHLFKSLKEEYEKYGEAVGFGHYGDVVIVFREYDLCDKNSPRCNYYVDSIGKFTWPKGTLAIDVVPILIDKNERGFIVCGIKEKEGVDVPVLIGGHIERHGFHLQSALEAVFEEAESEAAIILESQEDIISKPLPREVSVMLEIGGQKIDSQLVYIDCFRAGTDKKKEEEQKKAHMEGKRVDWTFVYALIVEFSQELDKTIIKNWLKAGDDLKDLLIVEVEKDETPAFDSVHHRTIFDVVTTMK
jgi:hypothetical protein